VLTSDRVPSWVAWTLGAVGVLFTVGLVVDLIRNARR
jgi:hypothetical protein